MKKNLSQYFYWIFALLLVLFSYFSFDGDSYKWSLIGVFIYLIPTIFLIFRIHFFRYYVFLFSLFFALQAILPSLMRGDYFTAQPNFQVIMDYEKDAIKGFSQGHHKITIDSMGYRTTKPIDYKNKSDRFRIFTIGGSTTQMIDIDDHRTWSHHLQVLLDKEYKKEFEVINTGMAGLRAEQNYGTLKYITKAKLSPDLVIILVGTNDWRRAIINQAIGLKEGSLSYPWENFSTKNSLIGRLVRAFLDKRKRTQEEAGVKSVEVMHFKKGHMSEEERAEVCASGTPIDLPIDFPENVSNDFSKALDGIRDVCKKENLACVFLSQPHGYKKEAKGEYRRDLSCNNRWGRPYIPVPEGLIYTLKSVERMGQVADFYNNYTKTFAEKNGMPFCDIDAQIEPSYRHMYDEVHFTEEGTKKVAEVVFQCLKEKVPNIKNLPTD
ncbi:MAG: SGNH/GDSL hydrolase family protein [Oligoflexia bacterium]|nr:SGNH/GDSL hydrolase family protein [Oligoflexia bacterium]